MVSTKQPVNYEALPDGAKVISFEVEARDRGNPPRGSRARVDIDILDVNDNHPEWDCSNRVEDELYPPADLCLYNMELRQDILVGYKVLDLLATDVDTVSRE